MENSSRVTRSEPDREYLARDDIRREVKPTTKQELMDGIVRFWETVTVEKCNKYINHLNKVIPRVIKLEGAATGY